jgi:hypothetical protein
MLSALKVKHFQPDFTHFFANGENAAKSKETSEFMQETLNIRALKFAGSHLAFYE